MKKDIENREDIMVLVNSFYQKVKKDTVIGYLFLEVVEINWEKHLPVMYDFWENVLFFTGSYNGNPMTPHNQLHKKSPLNQDHFAKWLMLFTQTVDELFEGEKANLAKQRAVSIATVMQLSVLHQGSGHSNLQ